MNRKSTKILLGIAVLTIWSTVFYRIYKAIAPEDTTFLPTTSYNLAVEKKSKQDTFTLLANYRDPFLGQRSTYPKRSRSLSPSPPPKRIINTPPPKPVATKPPKKRKPVKFPKVHYKGFVKNHGVTKALVNVNGKSQNLKRGQEFENVRISRITEDSIQVMFQGAGKWFFRE